MERAICKFCLDSPSDLWCLGSIPGYDTGLCLLSVPFVWKKSVGLCSLERSSAHRAVEEPWGKREVLALS